MIFQLNFLVVKCLNFLLTYSPQNVKSIIVLHDTEICLEVPKNTKWVRRSMLNI